MNTMIKVLGTATLLATSTAGSAGPLAIPNTFQADTVISSSDMNANFSALADAIGDGTTGLSKGIADNAAAISAMQTGVTCQGNDTNDIMVRVGSLCVDKYEASVWDTAAGGGTQFGLDVDNYPCTKLEDCIGQIFARSQLGVSPSSRVTLAMAQMACVNAGKRLLTIDEWMMAANGTDPASCNTNSGSKANTGATTGCESANGVADMVGNLFELVAGDFNSAEYRAAGSDYTGVFPASITEIFVGTNTPRNVVGFRCAR